MGTSGAGGARDVSASTSARWRSCKSFSLDETTDVSRDAGAPVMPDYLAGDNGFTGRVHWVRLDLGDDSHDHLIDPDHLLHIAITRQ
jgi:hypothetical protein